MQVRLLTASFVLVVGCGALGCKSAPKMSWWSSSKDAKVESTAVAHGAPQLPSEIAKQAEGVNTADPVQISSAPAIASTSGAGSTSVGGTAPAYAATTSPMSAYPSTGAQSYVPTTKPAASPAVSATASTNAMPYNPNEVPAAKSVSNTQSIAAAATLNSNPAAEDRYGNLSSPTPGPVTAPAPTTNTAPIAANSYPSSGSSTNTVATSPASSTSYGLGDRYAMPSSSSPAASETSATVTNASVESQQVQTASAIASTEPYRPGGTATYPGLATANAKYEVATRPTAPTNNDSSVPNVAYPSSGTSQYR